MHVNAVFDEAVQRWSARAFPQATAHRKRYALAHPFPKGSHKCAWHCHVEEQPPPERSTLEERAQRNRAKQTEFKALPLAGKQRWRVRAKHVLAAARARGSCLDEELEDDACEQSGGPWGLSLHCGTRPGTWPLSRFSISKSLDVQPLAETCPDWERSHIGIFDAAETFPDNIHLDPACYEGGCLHQRRQRLQGQLEELGWASVWHRSVGTCPRPQTPDKPDRGLRRLVQRTLRS